MRRCDIMDYKIIKEDADIVYVEYSDGTIKKMSRKDLKDQSTSKEFISGKLEHKSKKSMPKKTKETLWVLGILILIAMGLHFYQISKPVQSTDNIESKEVLYTNNKTLNSYLNKVDQNYWMKGTIKEIKPGDETHSVAIVDVSEMNIGNEKGGVGYDEEFKNVNTTMNIIFPTELKVKELLLPGTEILSIGKTTKKTKIDKTYYHLKDDYLSNPNKEVELSESSSSSTDTSTSSTAPISYDSAVDYNAWNHDQLEKNKAIQITGTVVQNIPGSYTQQLRVAIDDNYDKMVLVSIPKSYYKQNILAEDDNITINGIAKGITTYESTLGGEITIPYMTADNYTINSYGN